MSQYCEEKWKERRWDRKIKGGEAGEKKKEKYARGEVKRKKRGRKKNRVKENIKGERLKEDYFTQRKNERNETAREGT